MKDLNELVDHYFNQTLDCIKDITTASSDYNFCLKRFSEMEVAVFDFTLENRGKKFNMVSQMLQDQIDSFESQVKRELSALGDKGRADLDTPKDLVSCLLDKFHNRSMFKLNEVYSTKKSITPDETFKNYYLYIEKEDPEKKVIVDEKMRKDFGEKFNQFKNCFKGNYNSKEKVENDLRSNIARFEALQLPIAA